MIGTRLSHYEVRGHLGSGGMGTVWRARDTKLGRDVAIKTLPDELAGDADRLTRFEREARLLAALNHQNIATIHEFAELDGKQFLVMELVEGETLADRLRKGSIPLEESIRLASQISSALEAAHEKGVIHRDLKPANIKVTPDGAIKVLDFGLAKVVAAGGSDDGVTLDTYTSASGVLLGTVAYMAPEQARGSVIDKRADIWAFGVVLYEMLTGERPFRGENTHDTLAQILTKDPDLQRLPTRVRRLVAKCLEKDPKRRLRDIGDAWELLNDAEDPVATSAPTSRLNLSVALAAAILLVVSSILAFLYFGRKVEPGRVVRSALAAPEGASSIHSFAISPDGRTVVIAAVVKGKRQLWLRSLDSLQTQPLPTTDDATYPFWSPDSGYIGFFAQGSLKKIAAAGGPAESLCAVPDARGGSWNRDNVIVLSSSLGGRAWIQRISAAGGMPVDIGETNSYYTNPTFLPDGDRYLYVSRSQKAEGIYLGSLAGGTPQRLLPDVSAVVYSPPIHGGPGHLLFVRENALMAQRFDADRGQVLGTASVLAKDVFLTANQIYAPVSATGTGVLLYLSGVWAGTNEQIYSYDRAGKPQQLIGIPGDRQPALSPDEKFVAFDREGGVWLRDLNRGTDQVLVNDGRTIGAPIFSAAGDRFAFGVRENGIYQLSQRPFNATANDALLVKSSDSKAPTQWTSAYLVFQQFNSKTKRDIWVLPTAPGVERTPRPFLQTTADELLGQISPDGRWMAYTSDVSGRREVYARRFPEGDHEILISTTGGEQPRWARKSQELFFQAADSKMMVVPVNTQSASLTTGPPRALFDVHLEGTENGAQFQYDVTADGQHFFIATAGGAFASAPPLTLVLNWQIGLPETR